MPPSSTPRSPGWHPAAWRVIPDRHGTGTNGLLLAPAGRDRPLVRARTAPLAIATGPSAPGSRVAVEPLESLALDLDTPEDLEALAAALAARPRARPADGRGPRIAWALDRSAPVSADLEIVAIGGLPEIVAGAELGELIAGAAAEAGLAPGRGEVVVISQKAVSKAEGRIRDAGRCRRRASGPAGWRPSWTRTRGWSSWSSRSRGGWCAPKPAC